MEKIIIVSGGANGLGYELVKQLIEKDYIVCSIDFDSQKLNKIENEFNKNYYSFCGDISDETFVQKTIEKISSFGKIYGLINNAGEPSFKMPKDYKKEDIERCFKGLEGMILLSANVLRKVEESDLKIVNIMSSAALRGNSNESVYCATKWGEKGYTESLKAAYKGTSVKIIGVYPGGINTDFYKNSRDYVTLEKQQTFMDAKEVASIIISNVFNDLNLTVTDLIIERNQSKK
ncbi:MAG: SDR family oxidoreductase [Bacilli bacterium]|nr:SDR family oxidoreductase [Bacilli bacterium]